MEWHGLKGNPSSHLKHNQNIPLFFMVLIFILLCKNVIQFHSLSHIFIVFSIVQFIYNYNAIEVI